MFVLGPFLFLAHINIMQQAIFFTFLLYAYGTCLAFQYLGYKLKLKEATQRIANTC